MHTKRSARFALFLTAGVAFLLAWCTHAADLTWPERDRDPYPWPKPNEAGKIIRDRFANASTNALGTTNDVITVKKAITEHLKPQQVEVRELRWLSPILVMAYTRTKSAAFYYVTEKKNGKWDVITYYMLWVI